MKKYNKIVLSIASWQLVLALACLSGIIIRILKIGYWEYLSPYYDFMMRHQIISGNVFTISVTVLFPISFINCTGLFFKKNWGRRLSIFPSVTLILFGIWILWIRFAPFYEYDITSVFIDYILPFLISLVFILLGLLPLIYLNKPHVKEYFRSKPAQS